MTLWEIFTQGKKPAVPKFEEIASRNAYIDRIKYIGHPLSNNRPALMCSVVVFTTNSHYRTILLITKEEFYSNNWQPIGG